MNTSNVCSSLGCFPNPNAAADAAKFGTNMTGGATFNFDTTGVTGTYQLGGGGLIEIQLTSGEFSGAFRPFINTITLTTGVITDWSIRGDPSPCSFTAGPSFCL